jgi:SAM-dependent methyltransferase
VRALYTLTLFLSSALLFLVQPLAAKLILPTFGGAPAVWNASLVFFQTALLLGYLYAHFSTRFLGKRQPILHLGLMLAAGASLPFSLQSSFWSWVENEAAKGYANPSHVVVIALAGLVGLPFFILSAGAPLIQRWFSQTDDPAANDPYFLYGASNIGSMLGLFAYPFFFEPTFRLRVQADIWAAGFGVLILGMAICAVLLWRRFLAPVKIATERNENEPAGNAPSAAITWRDRSEWILLAAVPSSLLTGVTQFITTNVAPIPLLWVVPLALYLLTFTLAFTNKRILTTEWLSRIAPLLVCPLFIVLLLEEQRVEAASLHLIVFFACAWMAHSRLYDRRPNASNLTEFYVWVSVGGLVGGMFNGLLAPVIFRDLWEYPIALALICAMKLPHKPGKYFELWDWTWIVGVGTLTICAVAIANYLKIPSGPNRTVITLAVPVIVCFLASDRPFRLAGTLASFFAMSIVTGSVRGSDLYQSRSFFGVHRVVRRGDVTSYVHGNTLHGKQNASGPALALTYYHPTGPIGQVMRNLRGDARMNEIALVGLGVGSLAAYGQPEQHMTFFEIDPEVVEIATKKGYFTFVRDSKAKVDFVLGDARLTLDRQPNGKFGLIVLDAFSSDAIPVHLLTKEAMKMYMSKLQPNGLLAIHISNRYLDLEPVVSGNAKDLGLLAFTQTDGVTVEEEQVGKTASSWMLVSRKKPDLGDMGGKLSWWSDLDALSIDPRWTDDYSNVLRVWRGNQ